VIASPFLLIVPVSWGTVFAGQAEYHVPGREDAMKTIVGRLIKIAVIVIIILALGAGCAPSGRSALPVADRTTGSIESGYADPLVLIHGAKGSVTAAFFNI
jgi:hypothetical protein